MAMSGADLLIALGVRFDDRVTGRLAAFAPHAKVIHVDIDPAEVGKIRTPEVPIVGDVKRVLNKLNKLLSEEQPANEKVGAARRAWWRQIRQWKEEHPLQPVFSDSEIKPQHLMAEIDRVSGGNAIVTSDVGQHQMWAAQFYKFEQPRRWINSGGLGTMGFGLPAAMGAQLANPGATVACVTGESSIQMCLQELSTCKQYRLPIKIINLNNKYMGMVRQWQQFFHGNRYAESYMDALPDFVKLAEAYGHTGIKVEKPGDVEGALREAFKQKDRLVFMDFITDQAENVFPMIPGGKGLTEMILAEEL
jgi:acetolactate synthase-1/2/3 large subunit